MTIAPQVAAAGFTPYQYAVCLGGIAWRETLRFLHLYPGRARSRHG